jgi:hypothetical protein
LHVDVVNITTDAEASAEASDEAAAAAAAAPAAAAAAAAAGASDEASAEVVVTSDPLARVKVRDRRYWKVLALVNDKHIGTTELALARRSWETRMGLELSALGVRKRRLVPGAGRNGRERVHIDSMCE